jgi:hypothetical protein
VFGVWDCCTGPDGEADGRDDKPAFVSRWVERLRGECTLARSVSVEKDRTGDPGWTTWSKSNICSSGSRSAVLAWA